MKKVTIKKAQQGLDLTGTTRNSDGSYSATPYGRKTTFSTNESGKKVNRIVAGGGKPTRITKIGTKQDDESKRAHRADSLDTMKGREYRAARATNASSVNKASSKMKNGGNIKKKK